MWRRTVPSKYIRQLQEKMDEAGVGKIATVQGRYYAMDRDKRWDRVEKSYRAMVYGEGPRYGDPVEAVKASYEKSLSMTNLWSRRSSWIKTENRSATIRDHDAVIFYNFRPDRAIQLSLAFTDPGFSTGLTAVRSIRKTWHYVCLTHYSDAVNGDMWPLNRLISAKRLGKWSAGIN